MSAVVVARQSRAAHAQIDAGPLQLANPRDVQDVAAEARLYASFFIASC